jgi:hypothetical protein
VEDDITKPESTRSQDDRNSKPAAENNMRSFDWVTARSACSLTQVFKDLRLGVEQDVQIRNDHRLKTAAYEFAVRESDAGFKVILQSQSLQIAVVFVLAEHSIQVLDHTGNAMFEITINFDEHGQCQLLVNGEKREPWQVRRMALEDLMFRSL